MSDYFENAASQLQLAAEELEADNSCGRCLEQRERVQRLVGIYVTKW